MSRRRNAKVLAVLAVSAALAGAEARAFDLGLVEIHGFLTQSYLDTTHNNFLTPDSSDGTFEFTEFGVNFTSNPSDELRLGAQLFSRNLGVDGNFEVVLDWAVADYRWRDEFGLRVGKLKKPQGLYNEYRDADMTRPTILLPQALYSEAVRDLASSFVGGMSYGSFDLGSGGRLSYELWGGTTDIDDAAVIHRFLEAGAWSAARFLPVQLSELSVSLSNIEASMSSQYGSTIGWQMPVDGLRLNATFYSAESDFSATANYSGWQGQIPVAFALQLDTHQEDKSSCVGSIEYAHGNLLVAAEYQRSHRLQTNTFSGLPNPLPAMPVIELYSEAYYALVAYRFAPWLQLSSYYAESYPDRKDRDGSSYVLRGQPDYLAWNKDLAVAARFDVAKGWLLKLEYHQMDGAANLTSLWNQQGYSKDWSVFLARATFFF